MSLSCLSEGFRYAADDFCLAGCESGMPMVYSLYNTGMLSRPEKVAKLVDCKTTRSTEPKAILSIYESFPEQIINKLPLSLLILLRKTESEQPFVQSLEAGRAIAALASSTASVMKMIGYSAGDFVGLHRLLSKTPCFELHCTTDLRATNRQIIDLLNRTKCRVN